MLKIKGLKKKKGHKKHKHKDDDLFKPEELEAYRREHQQHTENADVEHSSSSEQKPSSAAENEEWRKFLALTSGVDDVLKKTQGDLDRIKSTSFFQRVPTPSEVAKQEEEKRKEAEVEFKAEEESKEAERRIEAAAQAAIVEVSDTESEEDGDDDIFDTAYIDAIAAGEVKLAYIPESPTEEPDDDPFDTTYAEKAILGPNAERKGKKLVPLGSAVEILTGRVQAPTCASIKRPTSSNRRQVFKERDLLLGSFDANANPDQIVYTSEPEPVKTTLLDEDAPPELASEPIDLSKVIITPVVEEKTEAIPQDSSKDILEEFDVLKTPEEEDEFALLAAESLSKTVPVLQNLQEELKPITVVKETNWNAFEEQQEEEEVEVDPFDTTFAENILPGQTELKIIEKEILNSDNDLDFNPRAAESAYSELIRQTVSIQLTNPCGDRESLSSLDRVTEDELNSLRPIHRDLLGGSNTDLSQLGDQPLQPKENEESEEEEHINYSDPFDTSSIDTAALPGTTELKFLERELLEDIKAPAVVQVQVKETPLSDDEFDPRAFETNFNPPIARKVSFDLPLNPKQDLLGAKEDDCKVGKPLTPYYERKDSIPEEPLDPFDTSFASNIAPGQAELKVIENELFNNDFDDDDDFDPRDEKQVAVAKVVQTIHELSQPKPPPPPEPRPETPPLDLLGTVDELSSKVLTPSADNNRSIEEEDIDPFDTSIAANILPGATELKLLETELIANAQPEPIKRNLTDPEFDPRFVDEQPKNILEQPTAIDTFKPLIPSAGKVSFDIEFNEEEDIDPFDTSIANNIGPGPSELKLLESELI